MPWSDDPLDSVPKQSFDDVVRLAAELCQAAHAVTCLQAGGRLQVHASYSAASASTALDPDVCADAAVTDELLIVPDLHEGPERMGCPRLTEGSQMRFYAAVRLQAADGTVLGVLCVLDPLPRRKGLTPAQQECLRSLARQTVTLLEVRRAARVHRTQRILHERILDSATDYAIIATDGAGRITRWNAGAEQILGWREEEMLGEPTQLFFTPEDREAGRLKTEMALALKDGSAPDERWHLRKGGERFWASSELMPLRAENGSVQGFLKILRDRTQQRVEAAERNSSELRFRSLVEVSPQVVWFGDAAGNITYCNPMWCEYTGLTLGDTSGADWASVIHPDQQERVLEVWRHAVETGGSYEVEIPFRRASDGQYRWFLARGRPVRDAAGLLESWIGIAIDIHDRKEAEVALRSAQEQLRLAVEATETGVFDYDLVADELKWDTRIRSFYGLAPDAPVDLSVHLACVHPDDHERADKAVAAAVDPDGAGIYDITYRTVAPEDGTERWVSAKGQTLFEDGRPIRLIGTAREVTESRRAEQALRETEERYRLASRATNDAIWDWNLATNHVLWNEALRVAHGYTPDAVEPTGDWWIGHIHPDDRARIDASIHAIIDGTGTAWSDEYRFLRADGSYADILDRGYVIRDAQGKATRMIGAMLDISERKRAEEHQRLLTGELQHRVKNTLAMVQAIASQTLRGATDLNDAREAFAARLISLGRAHDILTQASWTAAPILQVVQGALSVHAQVGAGRIRISGPDVLLGAKPALSLALALHELATNAAKYGALSNETGVVDLRWHVVHEDEALRFYLTWSEQGGPPILVQPARRGFGSRLIERSFAAEVGGEVKLTYAPTGLVCRLEVPLALMQEQRSEIAA
ncbi:PAS domain S-box protein [Methylorubrum extorquens]|uniref:PAS domain S-box protein n=1 Tax=Methylorubrum extorquens TaxID=408 RepID=UPI000158F2EE|nr:PAS domain S-box protein [Methylorubrum extorquens]ABY30280.1 PAS sensor protein [Methylorubrum extorquens PA1]KQP93682.1 histidine kinase [Methylobacterium sp. Leaf119]WIU41582.1 PAS domain S-box protein [Methylorubrum extorquens]